MHLTRTAALTAEIDALATRLGGRVGLGAVLGDLDRPLRRTWAPCLTPHRAWTWDRADRRDRRWWPQGVSVAASGRRAAVSWYAQGGGVRVSFLDLDERRYRHVELVVPTDTGSAPLRAHAGGIAWHGDRLYVAATQAGLWVCHTDDVLRGPDGYLLPVSHRLAPSEPFRFSFVGLDGSSETPRLVLGEYGPSSATRRLAHVAVEGGAVEMIEGGVVRAQGAVRVGEQWYVTASHGPKMPGSLWSGRLGDLREHRYALPMGPEDLAHDPAGDRLWTVTEHPHRRWVVAVKRSRF
ncbi:MULTISPECIES: hypothetical protein [unclassified Nocardioides]|uniref:hypothetical protein n=1 Tax=unclassified Nocardioides TaxID=2615069 RepID=UPI0009F0B2B5|nr:MULTISPECIES: hypothetical protein [unclassified Nocardioides]GAW50946.1 uncharacterized protein PD653B2_3282 [Nocardioides sp. PD653-B2]GAW56327.1 uncharacterized protein PD653_3763 [Nocardioides sp. PD653]